MKKEIKKEKVEAGPVLVDLKGNRTDLSDFMLGNEKANTMADELAVKQAVESGTFTEEEARKLFCN